MPDETQTFATHRRWIPAYHFFALPVLLINVFVVAARLARNPSLINGWAVLVSIALVTGIFVLRGMPLRAQDRIIRLEERIRLERLLPADLRGRMDQLTAAQLIGLRFAPDDEVAELTRRSLDGELRSRDDIKRAIKSWRPDTLRV